MKNLKPYILLSVGLLLLVLLPTSCGMLKSVPEGSWVLARNDFLVIGDPIRTSSLSPYVVQQPSASLGIGSDKVIFSETAVHETERNIRAHLRHLGYYDARVQPSIALDRNRAYVTYHILTGSRLRIGEVRLNLPEDGPLAEAFLEDTSAFNVRPGLFLSEELLDSESDNAAARLRQKGFYGISKNNFFFEADTSSSRGTILEVTIHSYTRDDVVREEKPMEQYHIGAVRIIHDSSLKFRESILRDLTTIRPGDLYDESDVNATYTRLSAVRAFSSVSVSLSERPDTSLVDCDININKSKSQGFKANVEASTNSSGLVGISPQLTFFHKNIFHGGEQLSLGFMGNFQFRFDDDVRADEFGISAGLKFPRFLGLRPGLFQMVPLSELKASYNFQSRPEYTRSIISTSFGYSGVTRSHVTYQFYPIQLNVVKLWSLDDTFYSSLQSNPYMRYTYQDHFDAGMGGMIYYSTASELNPKVSYSYVRVDADLSGNVLSLLNSALPTSSSGARLIWGTPYTQYVRGELTLGRTVRVGREGRSAVAMRLNVGAGYAYGNSSALPYEKQFYCGGAGSMRGWQARSLGPGSSAMDTGFIIPSQTGDLKMEANVEWRNPLFWKLEGAVFVDCGNVWTMSDLSSEPFLQTIASDWGLGIRCDLNFIVVRVDGGFKMYDPSRDVDSRWLQPSEWVEKNGFALHFGVGYPF